jgi:hypothetical protein
MEDLARLREFHHEYRIVPVGEFFIDPDYQRESTTIAAEIGELFLPPLAGTITVSEREIKRPNLAIIDGQNRWLGATMAEEEVLPALVYTGLTVEEEATIFALIQIKRRNLSTFQRFRAQLRANKSESLAIQAIVVNAGFTMDPNDPANSIRAVAALEMVYRRDPELLSETMHVLSAAWDPTDTATYSSDMIRGVAKFIDETKGLDKDRLLKALRNTTPNILSANASMLRAGRNTGAASRATAVAEAIYTEYLKARR